MSAQPRRSASGRTRVPLGLTYAVMLVLLYLPIALLFVFSFNTNTRPELPARGLHARLVRAGLRRRGPAGGGAQQPGGGRRRGDGRDRRSGLAVSIAVLRFRFRGRVPLLALAVLPLVVPFIVLAVALFLLFTFLDVPRSLLTIAVGHSVIALPFATLILLSRLIGHRPGARGRGHGPGRDVPDHPAEVVLPLIGPSLLSAWLTCFIVSFDEVALALFLAGGDPTFPVFLYGQLRFAQRLPVLIAMAVMLMAGTIALTLIAFRLGRRQP